MAIKLIEIFFFEFGIDLDLEISRSNDKLPMSYKCMVRFAQNKSSVNKLDGLFHIWPWPLTLPVTLVMISQGHILKLPYVQNIWPDRKKDKKRVNSLDASIFCWSYLIYVLLSSYAAVPFRYFLLHISVVDNISMIISLSQRRWCVFRTKYMLGCCSGFHSIYTLIMCVIRKIGGNKDKCMVLIMIEFITSD